MLPAARRSAVLASSDLPFRNRVRETLAGMRWRVMEADGGAEALAQLSGAPCEALVLESWLPDLEIEEFIGDFRRLHPAVDLVMADGRAARPGTAPCRHRNELLHALRRERTRDPAESGRCPEMDLQRWRGTGVIPPLPELVGEHPLMLEAGRRVLLVAGHATPVLIQGATGTGKEIVARALHRLSPRSGKPFVALNCAAIPEALLETELFGHARGAFTGAVQRRIGRLEAAHGGTLLLDEIGELPLGLQAKLLRFVECGELQRVGDNQAVRVDVRILAATHRPLAQLSAEGRFRADLYYRLAVFLIQLPPLSHHMEDMELLVEHFRNKRQSDVRSMSPEAMQRLRNHSWPGNVRELEHVLERATILAGPRTVIAAAEIEFAEDSASLPDLKLPGLSFRS